MTPTLVETGPSRPIGAYWVLPLLAPSLLSDSGYSYKSLLSDLGGPIWVEVAQLLLPSVHFFEVVLLVFSEAPLLKFSFIVLFLCRAAPVVLSLPLLLAIVRSRQFAVGFWTVRRHLC